MSQSPETTSAEIQPAMHFSRLTGGSYDRRKLFLTDHRGLIREAADACGYSQQFVSEVYYGEKHNPDVEATLLAVIAKRLGVEVLDTEDEPEVA